MICYKFTEIIIPTIRYVVLKITIKKKFTICQQVDVEYGGVEECTKTISKLFDMFIELCQKLLLECWFFIAYKKLICMIYCVIH